MQKYATKFYCEKCDYGCSRKFLFDQHLKTKKHNGNKMIIKGNKNMHICPCGRTYKFASGLSRHFKMDG